MKKRYKAIILAVMLVAALLVFAGCDELENNTRNDRIAQRQVANTLSGNQPTPTDISYSLERYNLIRRTYWVNGMREKANSLVCEI